MFTNGIGKPSMKEQKSRGKVAKQSAGYRMIFSRPYNSSMTIIMTP